MNLPHFEDFEELLLFNSSFFFFLLWQHNYSLVDDISESTYDENSYKIFGIDQHMYMENMIDSINDN